LRNIRKNQNSKFEKKIRLKTEIDKPLEKETQWSIVNIIFSK
jgi:hypothetical protein